MLPANKLGIASDLTQTGEGLSAYLRVFLATWNAELAPDGEFAWAVMSPPSRAPLLAVRFMTRYTNSSAAAPAESTDGDSWSGVLEHLEEHSLVPTGAARIFIDTYFRYIGDREILFIKRNERRFWTRTAAREDAESALAHLMSLEPVAPPGGN